MFSNRIRETAKNKNFLTARFWGARVLALALALYLLVDLAPLIVKGFGELSATEVVAIGGALLLSYLIIVRPVIETIVNRRDAKKAAALTPATAAIVDFSSLSTRESALHIPTNVPNRLREAVIWEAEMSEDISPTGVAAAAKTVLDRYRGGIPQDDVAHVLAVHEAGHATVALALGRAVVGIKRDDHSGATYSLNQFSSPTSLDIWNDMILTVAGTQAEQLWSKWDNKYPTNGHDDRSDAMGFVTILTFAGWTPDASVNSDIDSLLRHAQKEARRILLENKTTHDELAALVLAKDVVTAAEILEVAKKNKPAA